MRLRRPDLHCPCHWCGHTAAMRRLRRKGPDAIRPWPELSAHRRNKVAWAGRAEDCASSNGLPLPRPANQPRRPGLACRSQAEHPPSSATVVPSTRPHAPDGLALHSEAAAAGARQKRPTWVPCCIIWHGRRDRCRAPPAPPMPAACLLNPPRPPSSRGNGESSTTWHAVQRLAPRGPPPFDKTYPARLYISALNSIDPPRASASCGSCHPWPASFLQFVPPGRAGCRVGTVTPACATAYAATSCNDRFVPFSSS